MRRRGLTTLLFATLAIGAASLAFHAYFEARDPFKLDRERANRRMTATSGKVLPGTPDLAALEPRLAEAGLERGLPVFIRIFKAEFELELWMLRDGRFLRFATYPICRWSGGLGPKLREGDRQAPEGFYAFDASALNPNSRWHRSFNVGFPNAYDRAHGRTGTFLMVHGGCGSIGCYAMTDPVIDEVWRLITAALTKGQARIPVHIFPFRMTPETLQRMEGHRWHGFWKELKAGHDHFEANLLPPRVTLCKGRYRITDAAGRRDWGMDISEECPQIQPQHPSEDGA